MDKQKLRISQCMIVKNEEMNIERALSWGKGIVWEQIVVDTGSTDRTAELAEAMGAKVCHFEWIDDFAAAKNFAISKASGDWIAFLDADEYLAEEWAEKLVPLLESLEKMPYYVVRSPMLCMDGDNVTAVVRHCRFFRRITGLKYRNPIHEELCLNDNSLPAAHVVDMGEEFPIIHTGYTARENPRKRERNYKLLKKWMEKNPDSYIIMGYLGDNCPTGDKEAEEWYRKAIVHMPEQISPQDDRSALIFINLLSNLTRQRQEETKLKEIYELACHKMPWVYDIDYLMGNYYIGLKDYKKAAFHLEKSLQVAEQYGSTAYGIYMTKNIAGIWEKLAVCHYYIGNLPESLQYCVMWLKEDKRQFNALLLLLELLKGEKPEDTLEFLKRLYDVKQGTDRILLLRAALRAQADGLLVLLRKECSEEELEYLNRLNP